MIKIYKDNKYNKPMDFSDKIWIAFLDDDGKKVQGFFLKVKETDCYLKIVPVERRSNDKIFTIPFNRVLKMKEDINNYKEVK